METALDWLATIINAYKARDSDSTPARPCFRIGASVDAISRLEASLACRLPLSLRSLLSQTDGVTEEIEIAPDHWIAASIVIYSIDEMIDTNSYMQCSYGNRHVNRYCFFSTAGTDGIQFGFPADSEDREDASVLAWYPDETAAKCMGDGLLQFLTGWCSGSTAV
ncbi:MAG: SMI1/KNR4 family protein [Pirellulaceae bacterium]|nr:SMI1/KNR4 family protein [Pirellulaceae bacterium]